MAAYLKTDTVPLTEGETVEIKQLSGLDRFDLQEYMFSLEKPQHPPEPADDASKADKEAHLESMQRFMAQADHWAFKLDTRRVAMGLINNEKVAGATVDERQQQVGASFSLEDIRLLSVEVLKLSGMWVEPKPEADGEGMDQKQEPVDPK